MKRLCRKFVLAALGLGASAASLAHTGYATDTLFAGLTHPLAVDHLLAMLAVGLWSVAALPAGRRVIGPLVFLLGLLAGALLGVGGVAGSALEVAIAASVAVFGALLLAPRALPRPLALAVVAAAATLHGLAHGAELPAGAALGAYAVGFLTAGVALQAGGLALGRVMLSARAWVWRLAAAALGVVAWALMPLA